MFDEEVLHFPAAVLGRLVLGWSVLWVLYLGFVDELSFCASFWVNNGWQERVRSVWHMKGERLDMASYPRKRFYARRFGECRGLEGNSERLK